MKNGKQEPKEAILLAAFGATDPQARRALGGIEKTAGEKYGKTELRWAFTSKTVRARCAAAGMRVDSPLEALSRLREEGFSRVAVASLHVVPGEEFHELCRTVRRFSETSGGAFPIRVARPLLGAWEDMFRVAEILSRIFSTGRDAGEATIFVGHGNRRHLSDTIYIALDSLLGERGENLFAGTVQGHPGPERLLPALRKRGIRKARLVPLMVVAGVHARNDMAGNGPGSWKSVLEAGGIECKPHLRGLAEIPEIVSVWVDHLDAALSPPRTGQVRGTLSGD